MIYNNHCFGVFNIEKCDLEICEERAYNTRSFNIKNEIILAIKKFKL